MSEPPNEIVWIGIGSNVGDCVANLRAAAAKLITMPGNNLLKASSIYRTEPIGPGFRGDFYNAVVSLRTTLTPMGLLRACQRIENELGRDRSASHDRVADLDILFYGDLVLADPFLILPHPRIMERRFVLEPLAEISPKLMHPALEKTVSEMLKVLGKDQRVERLDLKAVI
jgi:2-amino-4-hydroxy-6-hydroxymethyldihydropteridine diphosphokinase